MATDTLNTQGYRGTRDLYPTEMRVRNHIYQKLRARLHAHGYEEYQGPMVEPFELYAAKSSAEIVADQLYHMVDRGDRKIAIRPEMTPTLARMVAAKFHEIPRPIRWYSIPTCMRYERPQRGRLREFDQLNVDLFGGLPVDEDVEILHLTAELMLGLGAQFNDFKIRVNHRGLINAFLYQELSIPVDLKSSLLRLLDKKDKLTPEAFVSLAMELGLSSEQIGKLDAFLSAPLRELSAHFSSSTADLSGLNHILKVFNALEAVVPAKTIVFDASVMRGFDYYTGLVFEVYDADPSNHRALFGGGRYDNLVSAFGSETIAGVGFGAGDVGLTLFCETHKLLPELNKGTEICVLRFSENDRTHSLALAQRLREWGFKVETPIGSQKFGKQIQAATKVGSLAVAFIGEENIAAGTFEVKFLTSGEQMSFPNKALTKDQFVQFWQTQSKNSLQSD
jgi:histidyl-tRNA synthetase